MNCPACDALIAICPCDPGLEIHYAHRDIEAHDTCPQYPDNFIPTSEVVEREFEEDLPL